MRLTIPWKYGFKSIKSIVRIRFTERMPVTTWNQLSPTEYGFYSNVNPNIDHPRWSQRRERRLGPNPVEFLEHYLGDWSLRLLLVTLALTPLRKLTRQSEPSRVRRTVGLWAYAYLCLHFSIYLVFDLELSLPQLVGDLGSRTYIALGFTAWMLLLPLAITSTDRWQRRLGRDWKTLHRLIYPAALLGAFHYLWLVKADTFKPLIYLGIVVALLAWRLPWSALRLPPRPVATRSP